MLSIWPDSPERAAWAVDQVSMKPADLHSTSVGQEISALYMNIHSCQGRFYRPKPLIELLMTAAVHYQKACVIRFRGSLTPQYICTCLAVSTLLSETERAFMSASGDTVGKTSCKRATSGDS